MAVQIPHPDLFVVKVPQKDKEEVSRQLESIGSIEELDEDNMLLRVRTAHSQPHTQWQRVSEIVGPSVTVQPVLSDDTGHPHYPTGELTVRFLKKPSDKELKKFAEKYQLRLRDRNAFVPEQAAFHVSNLSSTYLPDLVQKIAAGKNIKQAWANTKSHYKRMS